MLLPFRSDRLKKKKSVANGSEEWVAPDRDHKRRSPTNRITSYCCLPNLFSPHNLQPVKDTFSIYFSKPHDAAGHRQGMNSGVLTAPHGLPSFLAHSTQLTVAQSTHSWVTWALSEQITGTHLITSRKTSV